MNDRRAEPARVVARRAIDPLERTSESTPGGAPPLPFQSTPFQPLSTPAPSIAPVAAPAPAARSSFASSFGLSSLGAVMPKPAVAPAVPLDARAASDIAAEQTRREEARDRSREHERAGVPRVALVDLLYHDTDLADRITRDPHFRSSMAALGRNDLGSAAADPVAEARRRVLALLSTSEATEPSAARIAAELRLADPTLYELPLLVLEGELRPTFEEAKVLELTIAAAQPHASRDRHLGELVKLATDLSASSWPPNGDAATSLAKQIEQSTHHLGLPPRYLASQIERALLVGRHFKRRPVFGASYLRLELTAGRADGALPVYVPEAVASRLPLLPAFTARLVAELRPREDANEAQPEALVALALARRMDPVRRSHA